MDMDAPFDRFRGAWDAWDGACSAAVRSIFAAAGLRELQQPPSPATADLPFVASPTPLVSSLLVYLGVVSVCCVFRTTYSGASKSRWLKVAVQMHNVILIAWSSFMCVAAVREAVQSGYSIWGNEYQASETGLARIVWIFYVSKVYEFIDTFIMLLKGNLRQVSFLHVYHHASISTIWWAITYVAPGGDAYYSVALNSLVHVVMYSYYFMASIIGKNETLRAKYLWWGRYLTMFQMAQFVSMLAQASYCISFGVYNPFLARLLFYYMLTLLALFAHFFYQKYCRPPMARLNGKGSNGADRDRCGSDGHDSDRKRCLGGQSNGKSRNGTRHENSQGLSDNGSNGRSKLE